MPPKKIAPSKEEEPVVNIVDRRSALLDEIELGEFKQGAFSIAIEHQIPIIVFTFLDNKKRFPWSFGNLLAGSKGMPGALRVITHEPISTKNLSMSDMKALSDKVRNIMLKDLAES